MAIPVLDNPLCSPQRLLTSLPDNHARTRNQFRTLFVTFFTQHAMALSGGFSIRPAPGRFRSPKAIATLLLMFVASLNWAQNRDTIDLSEASLEDLVKIKVDAVYGASKHLQKVTDAPASITLVTSEEIRRFGNRTLGDVLRNVPGFYVTNDRNYTYAAVEGFGRTGDYNSRILVLVDGHRTNDNVYDEALLGTEFPIDIDLIERVEVIHDPGSALYGNNAFLAVINIITKTGSLAAGAELSATAASDDTVLVRTTYGGKWKRGWEGLFSGSLYAGSGNRRLFFSEFNTQETNQGVARNSDSDRFGQFFANLSHNGLKLQAVYGTRDKTVPTASFGTVFNDSRFRTTDERGYLDLGWEHTFPKDLELTARAYFDSYIYEADYPYRYSSENGSPVTLNHDFSNGAWWGEELRISKPLFANNRITVGSEFRDNFRQRQSNFDREPFVVYLDDRRHSTVWAFYGQDEYSFGKKFSLQAGVRHDQESQFGGTTNPRAALIYHPREDTTLKFLYGTAYRAPNVYELYYFTPSSGLPNPSLQPETIRTGEFTIERYVRDRYRFSGSLFRNWSNHLIRQVALPEGLLQFQNGSSARSVGTELVFEAKPARGFSVRLNYTYQHADDQRADAIVHDTPAHLANVGLLFPLLPKRVSLGLDLHYVSSRRTLAGNMAPGFTAVNLTVFSERLFKGLVLSGSIYNLLGTRYGDPGGEEHREDILIQDGRKARLTLSYRFGGGR
jgi:outer membrane receptor for ferrienterochelin and colicin